jgi:uracil-DNA glycosylase family 4
MDPILVPGTYPEHATCLVIGQAPGRTEFQKMRPFVGVDGLQLRAWLRACALSPDALAYDNVYPYWTGNPVYKPTAKEAKAGYARVADCLLTLPNVSTVLLVGGVAAHMVFKGTMAQCNGRREVRDGVTYVAVFHPGFYRNAGIHGNRGAQQAAEAEILTALRQVSAVLSGDEKGGVELPEGNYVNDLIIPSYGSGAFFPWGPVAVDVETCGDVKDPREAAFVLAAVAGDKVNLITFDPPRILPGAVIEVHNVPYDGIVLNTWDAHWEDSKMYMHMQGETDSTLKGWSLRNLDHLMLSYPEAERLGVLDTYCLDDAQTTHRAIPMLREMTDNSVLALYDDLEQPLLALWTKMSIEGAFYLDHEALTVYRDQLTVEVDELLSEVESMLPRGRDVKHCLTCGRRKVVKGEKCEGGANHKWEVYFDAEEPVNLNSPIHQLLPALNELGIPATSTGKGELEGLVGDFPTLRGLLDYRKAHKELSTYIDPWCRTPEGERLGGIWNPHGTWTMRVSSRGPNMQNIPNDLWRFFHAGEGYTLMTWDHAQLEVRLAAHLSQDPVMMAACREEDVHAYFQKELGLDDRRLTKVFVFGALYGGSADGFDRAAKKFGLDLDYDMIVSGLRLIKDRFRVYFEWARKTSELRRVPGLFGMIHVVPPGGEEYHRGLEAVNCGPQGGGGFVTKYGMLALHRAGYEVLCQVHDSITLRVADCDVEDAKIEVPRIMETACPPLSVPLKAELK